MFICVLFTYKNSRTIKLVWTKQKTSLKNSASQTHGWQPFFSLRPYQPHLRKLKIIRPSSIQTCNKFQIKTVLNVKCLDNRILIYFSFILIYSCKIFNEIMENGNSGSSWHWTSHFYVNKYCNTKLLQMCSLAIFSPKNLNNNHVRITLPPTKWHLFLFTVTSSLELIFVQVMQTYLKQFWSQEKHVISNPYWHLY